MNIEQVANREANSLYQKWQDAEQNYWNLHDEYNRRHSESSVTPEFEAEVDDALVETLAAYARTDRSEESKSWNMAVRLGVLGDVSEYSASA